MHDNKLTTLLLLLNYADSELLLSLVVSYLPPSFQLAAVHRIAPPSSKTSYNTGVGVPQVYQS